MVFTAIEVEIMNLAVVVLLMVYISLCVVVIGGWAFKTLDCRPNYRFGIDVRGCSVVNDK